MKRKLISFFLCLILLCPVLTAFAAGPKIIDDAGLLWSDEVEALEKKAQSITDDYQMDVVILTVDSYTGTYIETFADNYYDDHGYGVGPDCSGVLLVLAMDTREWAISTCGDAIYAITDYGIEDLFEEMAGYLSDDEFYFAFDAYLDALPYYFEAYDRGSPIDGYAGSYYGPGSVQSGTRQDVIYYDYEKQPSYGIALIIGLVLAAIVVAVMCMQMKTNRPQHSAQDYLKQGSYRLRRHQDIFLYSQVHKVRRQTENQGGGGPRGGSSVHRSSGGRSHGGGHGRF